MSDYLKTIEKIAQYRKRYSRGHNFSYKFIILDKFELLYILIFLYITRVKCLYFTLTNKDINISSRTYLLTVKNYNVKYSQILFESTGPIFLPFNV